MLERIHRVKGIGLLHDANGAPFALQKASLIYADNGRGKSTLASLFRSCSTNNAELIVNRRTIDGTNNPEVRLQFSNGQNSVFQNGSWDVQRPELLVFDADFVEKNVFTGGQVTSENRKNLLQFALGNTAVVAQQAYDLANENLTTAKNEVARLKRELAAHHGDFTLEQFRAVPITNNPEAQIEALNLSIAEAEDIQNIQNRLIPSALSVPSLEADEVISILQYSLDDVDLNAEERVKQHLHTHEHERLESWISLGQDFLDKETCPLCDQPLEGIELIQAYRSYFNQAYKTLIADVNKLDNKISALFGQSSADAIEVEFNTVVERLSNWQDRVPSELPALDMQTIRNLLSAMLEDFSTLASQKKQDVLQPISNDDDVARLNSLWGQLTDLIVNVNQEIEDRVNTINLYKQGLAAVDIAQLRQQITDINWTQRRHEAAVIQLFQDLDTESGVAEALDQGKETAKTQLSQVMTNTLARYKDAINDHLLRFGAPFSITELDANFTGGRGQATSRFALAMRGQQLALANGEHAFRTALSEGDKRTLALAFFVAYAESLPDLNQTIIVIDDPMCSLDLNRKQQTRNVLKNLHDNSEQLIILAHDAHFLRSFRKDLLRPTDANPADIKCIKLKAVRNNYTDFNDIDLDRECESAYFKAHRLLDEYLNGEHPESMDVAKTIRPMLEGYLHRRFPGEINQGLLFGEVVNSIINAQPPSPLVHAQNITDALNEINRYAGQFHHDTAPGVEPINVVDGELRTYVARALDVIHRGDA